MAHAKLDKYIDRKIECPNEHCGGTVYAADYEWVDGSSRPVWRCGNCNRLTPRSTRNRKPNSQRAYEAWLELTKQWEPVEEAIYELRKQGRCNYGVYLLHNHYDNYHVKQLTEAFAGKLKLSNWALQYHTSQARQDLEKAKQELATLQQQ